jgi:hypothetical protein
MAAKLHQVAMATGGRILVLTRIGRDKMVNYLLPRSALQINTAPVMNALAGMRQQRNVDRSFEDSQSRYQQDMEFREAQANQAQANSLREYNLRARQFDANQMHQREMLGIHRASAKSRAGENELRRQRLEFEIRKLKDGDPLKNAKVKLLQKLMGDQGAQPSQSADPKLLPQSNEAGPRDPNLVPTQAADGGQQQPASPMANLTPAQRQAMALNLVSPGMGNALLANDKSEQFGKKARNEIEGRMIDTAEGMARLSGIQKSFKPEFLTYQGGIKGAFLALRDKARVGGELSNDERTYLTDFTQFKQDAWDNLNRYIKEITGAQMSEAEAARLMRSMPNPGTSFWDGDSPQQFKSKMDNTVTQLKLAAARYNYLRSARFKSSASSKSNISLQSMRGIINKRAVEIRNQLRVSNPGVDPKLIQAQADRMTAQEFGI